MDSPKWMPINPCKDCNLKSKPDCEECSEDEVYEIVKAHQKSLLEYLIFTKPYVYYIDTTGLIPVSALVDMLKKLMEADKNDKITK